MQSYKLHVASSHLKDLHPYIEAPFNERYDASEVYHAVFDRSIPKLIEILLMADIEQYKYRDAFITLNEMVSHQEMKDEMITQGLVSVASAYLHHKVVEIRREAVLLLGSLVTIKRGRDQLIQLTFDGLSNMLFDPNLLARYHQFKSQPYLREACGWALCRIVTGRDGVDVLANSNLITTMIKSFMQFTQKLMLEVAKFNIYLLEAFTRILEYDVGILFFIKSGVVRRINDLLKNMGDNAFDEKYTQRINYLCLDCLAKISVNHAGKQEGIDELIITTASEFLDSPIIEESWQSTKLIMNCAIHLDGKKQCVNQEEDKTIAKLIGLLDTKILEFRKDIKQTLTNIAEYPEGFKIITRRLSSNIAYLDDLFSCKVVIALADLLPRTSILDQPPLLPQERIEELKIYALALCSFLRDYDNALQIAVEETVKIYEKLVPFLPYRQLSDVVAHSLYKLCNYDQQSKEGLYKYILTYGDVPLDTNQTTLKEEIYIYKKLNEVLFRK